MRRFLKELGISEETVKNRQKENAFPQAISHAEELLSRFTAAERQTVFQRIYPQFTQVEQLHFDQPEFDLRIQDLFPGSEAVSLIRVYSASEDHTFFRHFILVHVGSQEIAVFYVAGADNQQSLRLDEDSEESFSLHFTGWKGQDWDIFNDGTVICPRWRIPLAFFTAWAFEQIPTNHEEDGVTGVDILSASRPGKKRQRQRSLVPISQALCGV